VPIFSGSVSGSASASGAGGLASHGGTADADANGYAFGIVVLGVVVLFASRV